MLQESFKDPQWQADELEERLISFAVRIIKLSASLPEHQQENMWLVKFSDAALRRHPTMVRRRAPKVLLILFTNSASF